MPGWLRGLELASGHGVLWGGVGQEELARLLGPPAAPQPQPHSLAPDREEAMLPWVCCRLGGDGVSCPCGEQRQKLGLWKGFRGLLWVCTESSHRSLSISLCLAPSWGKDYESP